MASTTHWAPNTLASSSISSGRCDGGRVDRDLVGAGVEHALGVARRADPAADRERHEHLVGRPARELDDRVALVRGRRDVEEDQLVGAGAVVERGELDGVAGVADVEEARALDDAAGVDVHAGDDALVVHASEGIRRSHPSRPRRPTAHRTSPTARQKSAGDQTAPRHGTPSGTKSVTRPKTHELDEVPSPPPIVTPAPSASSGVRAAAMSPSASTPQMHDRLPRVVGVEDDRHRAERPRLERPVDRQDGQGDRSDAEQAGGERERHAAAAASAPHAARSTGYRSTPLQHHAAAALTGSSTISCHAPALVADRDLVALEHLDRPVLVDHDLRAQRPRPAGIVDRRALRRCWRRRPRGRGGTPGRSPAARGAPSAEATLRHRRSSRRSASGGRAGSP